jgi:transposase
MTTPSGTFVGIDVSKAQFDVAVRPAGAHRTSAHTEAGITMLVARLVSLRSTLVVLEATGGFEISLTGACAAAGLPVVVINPRQVRDFAKATGHLAKTDTLDAQVLAQFAEAVRPDPTASARCADSRAGRTAHASASTRGDARGGENSPGPGAGPHPKADPGPSHLAGTSPERS